MKIFVSLFSGIVDPENEYAYPGFYEGMIKKLSKMGNEIKVFISKNWGLEYPFEEKNRYVLEILKNWKPDLCILFNNTFYDISNIVECPIVIYGVDAPAFYSNKNNLKGNLRYKYIVNSEFEIDYVCDCFNVPKKNILYIPYVSYIQPENIPIQNNICFIGTKMWSTSKINTYNIFMAQRPSKHQVKKFFELIKLLIKNPLEKPEQLFSRIGVNQHELPWSKIGINYLIAEIADMIRCKTLDVVADLGLNIYGNSTWYEDFHNEPNLILNYTFDPVYSVMHQQYVYNSHKIGLNVNHIQAVQGFSWRVCDIMASNGCLVTDDRPYLKKYFPRLKLPIFSNPYEAYSVCKKIIDDDNLRKDIVLKCQEIINQNFRFKNIQPAIEQFLNVEFSCVRGGHGS